MIRGWRIFEAAMWKVCSARRFHPRLNRAPAFELIFKRLPHDLFKFTTVDEKGMGSHGERIGDGSRSEPWVFCRSHKPTLPAKCAVGVATESHIFMRDELLLLRTDH